MGFLNFWSKHRTDEEPIETQLDLLGNSQELAPQRDRVDGATVYRRFSGVIAANGGDDKCHPIAVDVETRELFDCNVRELYKAVGGKRNDRSSLPEIAQIAYIVSEGLSIQDLERAIGSLPYETQQEINQAIVSIVRENAKTTRKKLPW